MKAKNKTNKTGLFWDNMKRIKSPKLSMVLMVGEALLRSSSSRTLIMSSPWLQKLNIMHCGASKRSSPEKVYSLLFSRQPKMAIL